MTFGRPSIEERQAERAAQRAANLAALCRPAAGGQRGTYAGSTSGVPVGKLEPARPGKRTPTVAERAWMDWITAQGCIACRLDGLGFRPAAVHHILRGGQRIGHLDTLPLCDPGHHQQGQQFGMVSRHPWKARFEARYGTEQELLARLRAEFAAMKLGATA